MYTLHVATAQTGDSGNVADEFYDSGVLGPENSAEMALRVKAAITAANDGDIFSVGQVVFLPRLPGIPFRVPSQFRAAWEALGINNIRRAVAVSTPIAIDRFAAAAPSNMDADIDDSDVVISQQMCELMHLEGMDEVSARNLVDAGVTSIKGVAALRTEDLESILYSDMASLPDAVLDNYEPWLAFSRSARRQVRTPRARARGALPRRSVGRASSVPHERGV